MPELEILSGAWEGEMQIYNYDTGETETKTAHLFIQPKNSRELTMIYRYPADSENVSQTHLSLKKNGERIGNHDIVAKHIGKNENLVIKTEGTGKIEWQKVKFYYTYHVGAEEFIIKRDIHFLEQNIRITANDFLFKRAEPITKQR